MHDPHRQRNRVLPDTTGQSLAVPALTLIGEKLRHAALRPSRSVNIRATSQEAATTPGKPSANRGSPELSATPAAGHEPTGGATARIMPLAISVREPKRAGIAWVANASSLPKTSGPTSAGAVQPT